MRKITPEISVVTDQEYPENTVLQVTANGTYVAATGVAAEGYLIAGVQVAQTFSGGETTMRLLSAEGTHSLRSAADITDLTVPLRAVAGGQVSPAGTGPIVAMPLRTAVAGEWVEARFYRG